MLGNISQNFYRELQQSKIEALNNAPIKKDIVGEWTLVSSANTQQYLKQKNQSKFFNAAFVSANQCFAVNGREVIQLQSFGPKAFPILKTRIGFTHYEKQYKKKTTVEAKGSVLKTQEARFFSNGKGKVYDVEERFVKNGLLYIVNQINRLIFEKWEDIRCTRVYEKVDPFESSQTIQEEINGEWKPIGKCEEGPRRKDCEMTLMKDANISFNVGKIFNELHISYSFGGDICHRTCIPFDEDRDGFVTSFTNNYLVTQGKDLEVVRFVNNGHLFISNTVGGKSCIVVYKRV